MKEGILFIIFMVFLSDLCDTVSQLSLKFSINSLDVHINSISKAFKLVFQVARKPLAWLGLIFSIFSLAIWLFVLTAADLNFAFSLDSMRYILIALASMIVLKEKVGLLRWAGILTIICGIILVAVS